MGAWDYAPQHYSSTKYKYKYIHGYDRALMCSWERGDAIHKAERAVERVTMPAISSHEPCLLFWLSNSVHNNNLPALRYLLTVGIHPGTCNNMLLEHAINCNRLEMAALLRKHGASLPFYLRDKVRNKIDYLNNPRRRTLPNNQAEREWWECIQLPSVEDRRPLALYKHVDLDVSARPVMQSWPPSGTTQHPPVGTKLPDEIHLRVLDLWRAVGSLRRAEAKVLAPHNWWLLRRALRRQQIAMFWLGETQKRLCAPGGQGRAMDRAAYREECGDLEADAEAEKEEKEGEGGEGKGEGGEGKGEGGKEGGGDGDGRMRRRRTPRRDGGSRRRGQDGASRAGRAPQGVWLLKGLA